MIVDQPAFTSRYLLNQLIQPHTLLEWMKVPVNRKLPAAYQTCPFHPETEPTLWIYSNHQEGAKFYCINRDCKFRAGDSIDLIRAFLDVSYPEALRYITEKLRFAFTTMEPFRADYTVPLLEPLYGQAEQLRSFVKACHENLKMNGEYRYAFAHGYLEQYRIPYLSPTFLYGVCNEAMLDSFQVEQYLQLPVRRRPDRHWLVVPYWSNYHTVCGLKFIPSDKPGQLSYHRVTGELDGYFGIFSVLPTTKQLYVCDNDTAAAFLSSDCSMLDGDFHAVIAHSSEDSFTQASEARPALQEINSRQRVAVDFRPGICALRLPMDFLQIADTRLLETLGSNSHNILKLFDVFPRATIVQLPQVSLRAAIQDYSAPAVIAAAESGARLTRIRWLRKYLEREFKISQAAFHKALLTCNLDLESRRKLVEDVTELCPFRDALEVTAPAGRDFEYRGTEYIEEKTGYSYRRRGQAVRINFTNFTVRLIQRVVYPRSGCNRISGLAYLQGQSFPFAIRESEILQVDRLVSAINRNAAQHHIDPVAAVLDPTMRRRVCETILTFDPLHRLEKEASISAHYTAGWIPDANQYANPNWTVANGRIEYGPQHIDFPFDLQPLPEVPEVTADELHYWFDIPDPLSLAWGQIVFLIMTQLALPAAQIRRPLFYVLPDNPLCAENRIFAEVVKVFGQYEVPVITKASVERWLPFCQQLYSIISGFPLLLRIIDRTFTPLTIDRFFLEAFSSFHEDLWLSGQAEKFAKLAIHQDVVNLTPTMLPANAILPSPAMLSYLLPRAVVLSQTDRGGLIDQWVKDPNPHRFGHWLFRRIAETAISSNR